MTPFKWLLYDYNILLTIPDNGGDPRSIANASNSYCATLSLSKGFAVRIIPDKGSMTKASTPSPKSYRTLPFKSISASVALI